MRKHWKLVLAFFFTFMIGNFCGWLVHDSSETAPATALPPTSVASPTQTPTPVVATATVVRSTAAVRQVTPAYCADASRQAAVAVKCSCTGYSRYSQL